MSPKVSLLIGALFALVFGLALSLAPTQMLPAFGMSTPTEAIVLSRDIGVTLIGIAFINFLARDSIGDAVRAILIGNIVIQLLEAIVNGYEIAVGTIPMQGAGGVALHLVLAIIFWAGLRRA